MTVVVVVISFSIIVSCIFISLLLVTVGIVYSKMGSNINVITIISFDGEDISFEARLVIYIYIYSTSIPPIMIMNRIYENKNLLYICTIADLLMLLRRAKLLGLNSFFLCGKEKPNRCHFLYSLFLF